MTTTTHDNNNLGGRITCPSARAARVSLVGRDALEEAPEELVRALVLLLARGVGREQHRREVGLVERRAPQP